MFRDLSLCPDVKVMPSDELPSFSSAMKKVLTLALRPTIRWLTPKACCPWQQCSKEMAVRIGNSTRQEDAEDALTPQQRCRDLAQLPGNMKPPCVREDLQLAGLSFTWWKKIQDRAGWRAATECLLQHT